MLKIDSLRIRYGNVEAVKGISLEVQHREIVALLGANGAGKSSTLRGVMNLSPKFGGRVFLRGEDISHLDTSEIVMKGC
jgi:branched-chain amino acid transport system ATP-binding protein